MKSNIYKSAAQVTIFSIIEKSLSFVYRIILSRTIGAEGIGIYSICLSVFSVFLTAASSGIPITVSRLIAKQNANHDIIGKHAVVTAGVVCTLLFTIPAAILIYFGRNWLSFLFEDTACLNIFLLLLPALILTSIYAVMRGSFWGNKQFLPYSVIELAEDAVMVICGCILVNFAKTTTDGAFFATVAVLISYIFSFAVSLFWYFYKGGRFVNPKTQLKPLLSSSLPITAMRTSTALLNSLIAMFLPALLMSMCGYTNSQAVSLYGIAVGMSLPILFIPNSLIGSIAVVIAPELSENFYKKRTNQLRIDIEKSLKSAIFIAVLLIPVLFSLGNDIGIWLYSNQLSGKIIKYFAFILLPMCISMISTTILNSMNKEVKTLIYFFISAIAMLVCTLLLTKNLGIYAYLIGLSLSFLFTAILNIRLLKRQCKGLNFSKYLIFSIIICLTACLFGMFLNNLFDAILTQFYKIFVVTLLILMFTLTFFYATEMLPINPLKSKIKPFKILSIKPFAKLREKH